MSGEFHLRQRAIRLWLADKGVAEICRQLNRGKDWVYKWRARYQEHGADGLCEQSRAPLTSPWQLSPEIRRAIVASRDRLVKRRGAQARYRLAGAPTIRHDLEVLGYTPLPSLRSIERVLQRADRTWPALRLQPTCAQTHYPGPRARHSNEVHQCDLVGPRYLRGSHARYYFLVYKDAYDQTPYVEFHRAPDLDVVMSFIVRAWQRLGLPRYLQVDNGHFFAGTGRWPGSLNRFIRLALLVGVEVVFIPEGEPWWNGSAENFNGWFQARLLALRLRGPAQVRRELQALMEACYHEHLHPHLNFQTAAQVRRALTARSLPADFKRHQQPLRITVGKITFIRKVRVSGRITLLGVKVTAGKRRHGQYVRATLYTRTQTLKVYLHGRLVKQLNYPIRGS